MRILNVKHAIQPRIGRAGGAVQTIRPCVWVSEVSARARDERVEVGRARVARGGLDHCKLFCGTLDWLSRKNCRRGPVKR